MSVRRGSRPGTSRRQEPDSIAKNTAASLASQVTTASLTALLTVFLVRALGAKEYGLFALTMGVGATTLAFADMGISFSTARFVAEHRGRDTELRALFADALKLKIVVTGLVCALLAALSSVIASIYRDPDLVWPLRIMALATFGQSTYLMILGVSTARGRTIVNVRLVAAESLLEVSASVALVLAGAGAAGAVLGRAIGYVLGATIAAFVVLRLSGDGSRRFMSLPRRETIRRISGYAPAVFAIDVSYTVTASLSVLILGAYAGSAASGIYQAPVKLITLIMYVGLSVSNGVGPRLARSPGREPDVPALQNALRGMIDFQCLLLAPAIIWAKPITHLLLGPGYARSADVLVSLAPYIFFSGLAPLVTTTVNYMGEAQRRIPISIATLCVAAAAGFLLIPRHGVIGAAIATDLAFGFYTLAHIWLCRRLLGLRMEALVWSLVCGLTAAVAMAIVLASVGTEHLTFRDWVIGAVGGVGAFVSMLIFTREIRGVHIARAAAIVGGLFARRDGVGREPSPEPPMLPRHAGVTAQRRIAASVAKDTMPAPVAAPAGAAVGLRGRLIASAARRWPRGVNGTGPPRVETESLEVASAGTSASATHSDAAAEVLETAPLEFIEEPVAGIVEEPVAGIVEEPAARVADAPAIEVSRTGPAAPALGDRVSPGSEEGSSERIGVLRRRRRRLAVARAQAAVHPVADSEDVAVEGRSPASMPPAWFEGRMSEPVALGHAIAAPGSQARHRPDTAPTVYRAEAMPSVAGVSGPSADDDGLAPAAQPPAWLLNRASLGRVAEKGGPDGDEPSRRPQGSAPPAGAAPGSGSADAMYQIAWRLESDAGVFELRPAGLSRTSEATSGEAPASERSAPVPWAWRMPPAPTPEARRAHDALVDTLVSGGWRPAGGGDAWFADWFRSPGQRHQADARQSAAVDSPRV
jgi:O-antigen/teichoic acid export membrane protein